ncbi:MAG: site-2 protease family protein, partial [Patescibacteria group bacterium]
MEIFIFQLLVLVFSVMIHEISHGYMAERLGDPTARLAGRLTLNPLKHLDPFGSVLLPFLLYYFGSPVLLGWAKPVPYNPYNLHKDYQHGPLKVALAGPLSNIGLFI